MSGSTTAGGVSRWIVSAAADTAFVAYAAAAWYVAAADEPHFGRPGWGSLVCFTALPAILAGVMIHRCVTGLARLRADRRAALLVALRVAALILGGWILVDANGIWFGDLQAFYDTYATSPSGAD